MSPNNNNFHREENSSIVDCNTSSANGTQQIPYQHSKYRNSKSDCVDHIQNTEIPKIIHFIWLGSHNPIPSFSFLSDEFDDDDDANHELTINDASNTPNHPRVKEPKDNMMWNECMNSWKKYHPSSKGWIVHLWTEESIIHDVDRDDDDEVHDEGAEGNPMAAMSTASKTASVVHNFQIKLSRMQNSQGFQHAMKIENYGMASDILRLEILNAVGGVYIDVDYCCVDSLDGNAIGGGGGGGINDEGYARGCNNEEEKIMYQSKHGATLFSVSNTMRPIQLFCGASNVGCVELNNGLMGCRKGGHPIVWNMMDSIHGYFKEIVSSYTAVTLPLTQTSSVASLLSSFLDPTTATNLQTLQSKKCTSMDVIEHTGPGLLTRSVCHWLVENRINDGYESNCESKHFATSQVTVFPYHVFHPFPNHLRKELSSGGGSDGDGGINDGDGCVSSNIIANPNVSSSDGNGHSVATNSSALSLLKTYNVLGETKAIHLWGCSWQQSNTHSSMM